MNATNSLLRRELDRARDQGAKHRPTGNSASPKRETVGHGATWPPERVAELERLIAAGLSCSQIANAIGVTRNAVIGKVNRLGLTRPQGLRKGESGSERKRAPWRPKIVTQARLLLRLPSEPLPRPEEISIFNGRGCSLLELSPGRCRWPINDPGDENFCFCGNAPAEGFPYCVGHARIAYKWPARMRTARS